MSDKSINRLIIETPLGQALACATAEGVCLLEFAEDIMPGKEPYQLEKLLNGTLTNETNAHLDQLKLELDEYFEGSRKSFTVSLHTPGTEFQRSVWQSLQLIPYGRTVSYKEQAIRLNNLKAVRAVASANGSNRIAIVIPCHRVVGGNGELTGYRGGLHRKKWLLDFERQHSSDPKQAVLFY